MLGTMASSPNTAIVPQYQAWSGLELHQAILKTCRAKSRGYLAALVQWQQLMQNYSVVISGLLLQEKAGLHEGFLLFSLQAEPTANITKL